MRYDEKVMAEQEWKHMKERHIQVAAAKDVELKSSVCHECKFGQRIPITDDFVPCQCSWNGHRKVMSGGHGYSDRAHDDGGKVRDVPGGDVLEGETSHYVPGDCEGAALEGDVGHNVPGGRDVATLGGDVATKVVESWVSHTDAAGSRLFCVKCRQGALISRSY